jgi:choline dehydrogenase-like flavoprotein
VPRSRNGWWVPVLLTSPPLPHVPFDVCVMGAGPVGLALALEAADRGLQVLLLEAGGTGRPATVTPAETTLDEVSDAERHAPLSAITRRGLGGSSWLWGGRCVPFEPVDFLVRDFVPHSGWPLTRDDVAPWEQRAAAHLDCGTPDFHAESIGGWDDTVVRVTQRERWSRRPKLAGRLGARVLAHPGISVLARATVTDVVLGATDGAVTGLQVRHGSRVLRVTAHRYVLAGGGLATTRLLLKAQRSAPTLFGGASGPLGRYYMGHLTGSIATIELSRPDDFREWGFRQEGDGTFTRRRFTFSDRAQQDQQLLNTAFYLGNLPLHDPAHGRGVLSLLLLALALPGMGSRLASPETRRRNLGEGRRHWGRHVRNVVRRPLQIVTDLAGMLRLRYLATHRRSVFVFPNDAGAYSLRYHAEQVPQPDSRVILNGLAGPDGTPGIEVDFRYAEQDVDSVLRAHEVLDRELRATGHGRLAYRVPEEERADAVRVQAIDGYHQIGTTRMSDSPDDGVVDRNCKVHDLSNLYVASSSVFPTAGEANPTFMAVTLAVRLAHHLGDLPRPARTTARSSEHGDPSAATYPV